MSTSPLKDLHDVAQNAIAERMAAAPKNGTSVETVAATHITRSLTRPWTTGRARSGAAASHAGW